MATNGAAWEELKGFASNDLELHATKTGLALNTPYRVRYRAKNIYGWGEYSESAIILTIQEPAQPDPVETQVVSSNVLVTWSESESFGSAITRYEVQFRASDGTMWQDSSYCASEPTTSCLIPMSQLTSPTEPFQLALGTLIQASVRAVNSQGPGEYSELNTDTSYGGVAYVQTRPSEPAAAPERNPAAWPLSVSEISIIMPEVANGADEAGGSDITSYNLEWNAGAGTSFVEIVGGSADNLNREVTVATTPGQAYLFRYRVRNVFGWSDGFSPQATILSANIPDTPAAATTEISGQNVKISWAAPSANYASITSYKILILSQSGALLEETLTCDGFDGTIIADTECFIPLTLLIVPDFNLAQGDSVRVQVSASNSIGESEYSVMNSATDSATTAFVETIPQAPASVARGDNSSYAQIQINWVALTTPAETGGAPILSY